MRYAVPLFVWANILTACGAAGGPSTINDTSHLDHDTPSQNRPAVEASELVFSPAGEQPSWLPHLTSQMVDWEAKTVGAAITARLQKYGAGRQLQVPAVNAVARGSMTADDTFVFTIRPHVQHRVEFSPTPPQEKVEEHRLVDHTGVFTDTDKIRRKFHRECKRICTEGRYESDGHMNVLFFYGQEKRNICHTRGGVEATGKTRREQWCDVYQNNSDDCNKPNHEAQHPIREVCVPGRGVTAAVQQLG